MQPSQSCSMSHGWRVGASVELSVELPAAMSVELSIQALPAELSVELSVALPGGRTWREGVLVPPVRSSPPRGTRPSASRDASSFPTCAHQVKRVNPQASMLASPPVQRCGCGQDGYQPQAAPRGHLLAHGALRPLWPADPEPLRCELAEISGSRRHRGGARAVPVRGPCVDGVEDRPAEPVMTPSLVPPYSPHTTVY